MGNDKDFTMHIYRHEKMSVKPHECIHCGFTSYIHRGMYPEKNLLKQILTFSFQGRRKVSNIGRA